MPLLIYSIILFFSFNVNVSANPIDKVVFQYAGEIGKYSFGVGKKINKYYSLSLHYGIVPATEIQNKIETYAFKNNLHLFQIEYKKLNYEFYTGINMFHVPGDKYKTQEISGGTPDNYYRQSSVRAMVYLGNEVSYGKNVSFYAESGIDDIWIISSTNNDSIDYKDHVSLGVGFNYKFN